MRDLVRRPLFWPTLALLLLLGLNTAVTPSFVSMRIQDGHLYGSLIDILRNGAPVLLVALGMTLVIATRGIDLSVGAVAAISGAVACVYIAGSNESATSTVITAIFLAVGVCILLGLWNGFLVSVIGIQPIIATLVLMTAGRGLAMLITDGQITTVTNPAFKVLGAGFFATLPVAILVALAVFGITSVLARRTALGLLIESVGINPEASRLAGIHARTITWTVYVFSGFCAGIAGLMIASNTSAADANNAGLWIELDAILAVVIGGTSLAGGKFSLTGTLIGAMFIQTLATTIPTIGIPAEANYLFKAVVVIAVCLLQSPKARAALRNRRPSRPVPVPAAGTEAA
ncbi:ABC transporter permease [Kribbella sp. NPDC023855]|uniref:ABC transporter permease n=1 Tax=Kribbella sp. NPDC023855 TaxID=3154698 RepID=UPI0033C93283